MKIKTRIKAGALVENHAQTLPIKTRIKAGALVDNHNQAHS